jgi:hypothetical protein
MNEKNRVEKIRCDEPGCTCVVAERRADGTIVIRVRHHGETHITIIPPVRVKRERITADCIRIESENNEIEGVRKFV